MDEILVCDESSGQQDDNYESLSALKDKFNPTEALRLRQEKQNANNKESSGSLKEFYDSLENPINNDETLLSIIDAYASKRDGLGGLYGSLQKVGIEQKESGFIDGNAYQKFEEKMFQRWKKSVVGMTKEEFIAAKNTGSLEDGFKLLRKFIINHSECSSEAELRQTIGRITDKDASNFMYDILERYNWNLDTGGWKHVKSRYVNARQEDRITVDHRLYLNTDSTSTHAVVDALVDCYEKNHLPYYFKFDEVGRRADTVVIYTSTKDLMKNIDVLRQLKKEHPDLAEHFHQPPVLTGVIDGNIGYGAEPEKSSYSNVRANLLDKVLKSATADWISAHQNDVISFKGEKMHFSDFVVEITTRNLKADFRKRFSFHLEREKKWQQSAEKGVDEIKASEAVTRLLGYNQQDLQENSKMFKYIKGQLRENFPAMMESLRTTGGCDLTIKARNGKNIQIAGYKLMTTLEKISPQIAGHYRPYLDDIRARIRTECVNDGIDPNKFVFDKLTVAKMKKQNREDRNQAA